MRDGDRHDVDVTGSALSAKFGATSVIGTTLTAAPLLSLIGTAAALAYGVLYLYLQLKASKAKGKVFIAIQRAKPNAKPTN
ncbi:hypothetical protein [Falseniella ignava]|uniref:hypothetical protein n=1 Tax=Falseniella ignava TaxID=137730 RepID=UPI0015DEEE66|nr:hypothetical protein [Falseniella ignava]